MANDRKRSSLVIPPAPPLLPRPGLLAHIGNTPLVRITKLSPNPSVEIWAKL